MVPVRNVFAFHEQSGKSAYVEGQWLVVPAILCEGNADPVDDYLTINFSSGVANGPSETAPHLGRHEVALEEHAHIGGQEINWLADVYGVHARVFRA